MGFWSSLDQQSFIKTRTTNTSNENNRRMISQSTKNLSGCTEAALTVTAKNKLLAGNGYITVTKFGVTATPIAAVQIPTPALPETPGCHRLNQLLKTISG